MRDLLHVGHSGVHLLDNAAFVLRVHFSRQRNGPVLYFICHVAVHPVMDWRAVPVLPDACIQMGVHGPVFFYAQGSHANPIRDTVPPGNNVTRGDGGCLYVLRQSSLFFRDFGDMEVDGHACGATLQEAVRVALEEGKLSERHAHEVPRTHRMLPREQEHAPR